MPVLDDRSDEVLLGYEDPADEPSPPVSPESVDPPSSGRDGDGRSVPLIKSP